MLQHQNYTREVQANQEEALSKIVAKVPRRSVVLDIGCGSGMMGRYLSENNECIVDGVDIDPAAVAIARPKYRKVSVFNLEKDSLLGSFTAEAYDCIVMADVIEHLVYPEQLFEDVKKLLKPDGILLFSIPNITHLSAGLELVLGKFEYQNSGLLDATHVRFYSRQGFIDKLESCGIYIESVDTVRRDVDKAEFQGYKSFPRQWIRDIIRNREDAQTYQWIMSARLFKSVPKEVSGRVAGPVAAVPAVDPAYLTLNARLYWSTSSESGYSERNSMAGYASTDSAGEHFLNFKFTELNCRYPICELRVDPSSDTSVIILQDAVFTAPDRQVFWSTHQFSSDEMTNADVVPLSAGQGFLVFPKNSDPQWNPVLGAEAYQTITAGCMLSIRLTTSSDAACRALAIALLRSSSELQSRQRLLEGNAGIAAEKDSELDRLRTQLKTESIRAEQAAVMASDFQIRLTAATQALAESNHHMQNLTVAAITNAQTLTDISDRLQVSEHKQQQILQTLSWRITAPLRMVRRWLG